MRKRKISHNTELNVNDSYQGERIEVKIERVTTNNEPIDATAEIIFTELKDGVLAGYNIRTDRFEVAQEAMDKVSKSRIAQRDSTVKLEPKNESVQGEKSDGNPAA